MTEVVRKGILEAEEELQKANEEKLIEEVCVCTILVSCLGKNNNNGKRKSRCYKLTVIEVYRCV